MQCATRRRRRCRSRGAPVAYPNGTSRKGNTSMQSFCLGEEKSGISVTGLCSETAHRIGTRSGTPLTCIELHLQVSPCARATPATLYVLRFPASCPMQFAQEVPPNLLTYMWSAPHHRSRTHACVPRLSAFLYLCLEPPQGSGGVLF